MIYGRPRRYPVRNQLTPLKGPLYCTVDELYQPGRQFQRFWYKLSTSEYN